MVLIYIFTIIVHYKSTVMSLSKSRQGKIVSIGFFFSTITYESNKNAKRSVCAQYGIAKLKILNVKTTKKTISQKSLVSNIHWLFCLVENSIDSDDLEPQLVQIDKVLQLYFEWQSNSCCILYYNLWKRVLISQYQFITLLLTR